MLGDFEIKNESVTADPGLPAGQIKFYDNFIPSPKDGNYSITVTVGKLDQADQTDIQQSKVIQKFSIRGPRFVIPVSDIHAMAPASQTSGQFETHLPYIVFNKRVLPWERGAGITGIDENTPWITLLVLKDDELEKAAGVTGADDNTKRSSTGAYATSVKEIFLTPENDKPKILKPKLPIKSINEDEETETFNIIQLSGALFNAIVPRSNELPYLAHYRNINTGDDASIVGEKENGEYSIVMANRFPTAPAASADTTKTPTGVKYNVHLVSLEGCQEYFPVKDTDSHVQLVSLASWFFTCLPNPKENFDKLMLEMLPNPQATNLRLLRVIPDNLTDDTDGLKTLFYNGFIPLPYRIRTGEDTLAWYRGPFTPSKVDITNSIFVKFDETRNSSRDAFMIFNKQLGMFDQSYACAWQIGQSLALADMHFAQALVEYRWKIHQANNKDVHTISMINRFNIRPDITATKNKSFNASKLFVQHFNRHVCDLIHKKSTGALESKEAAPTPRKLMLRTFPAKPTAKDRKKLLVANFNSTNSTLNMPPIPTVITKWVTELRQLKNVPFNYLVADERLLPVESIRFFHVDGDWIDALLKGALSAGTHTEMDLTINLKLFQTLRQETTNKKTDPVCGLLLRSAVVSGWPGLIVEAYNDENNIEDTRLQPVRKERLSSGILLRLFNDVPKHLRICEPHEQLCFGVEGDSLQEGKINLRRLVADKDNPVGKGFDDKNIPLPMRTPKFTNTDILDVSAVLNKLNASEIITLLKPSSAGSSKTISPSEFAIQLVRSPYEVIFDLPKDEIPTPNPNPIVPTPLNLLRIGDNSMYAPESKTSTGSTTRPPAKLNYIITPKSRDMEQTTNPVDIVFMANVADRTVGSVRLTQILVDVGNFTSDMTGVTLTNCNSQDKRFECTKSQQHDSPLAFIIKPTKTTVNPNQIIELDHNSATLEFKLTGSLASKHGANILRFEETTIETVNGEEKSVIREPSPQPIVTVCEPGNYLGNLQIDPWRSTYSPGEEISLLWEANVTANHTLYLKSSDYLNDGLSSATDAKGVKYDPEKGLNVTDQVKYPDGNKPKLKPTARTTVYSLVIKYGTGTDDNKQCVFPIVTVANLQIDMQFTPPVVAPGWKTTLEWDIQGAVDTSKEVQLISGDDKYTIPKESFRFGKKEITVPPMTSSISPVSTPYMITAYDTAGKVKRQPTDLQIQAQIIKSDLTASPSGAIEKGDQVTLSLNAKYISKCYLETSEGKQEQQAKGQDDGEYTYTWKVTPQNTTTYKVVCEGLSTDSTKTTRSVTVPVNVASIDEFDIQDTPQYFIGAVKWKISGATSYQFEENGSILKSGPLDGNKSYVDFFAARFMGDAKTYKLTCRRRPTDTPVVKEETMKRCDVNWEAQPTDSWKLNSLYWNSANVLCGVHQDGRYAEWRDGHWKAVDDFAKDTNFLMYTTSPANIKPDGDWWGYGFRVNKDRTVQVMNGKGWVDFGNLHVYGWGLMITWCNGVAYSIDDEKRLLVWNPNKAGGANWDYWDHVDRNFYFSMVAADPYQIQNANFREKDKAEFWATGEQADFAWFSKGKLYRPELDKSWYMGGWGTRWLAFNTSGEELWIVSGQGGIGKCTYNRSAKWQASEGPINRNNNVPLPRNVVAHSVSSSVATHEEKSALPDAFPVNRDIKVNPAAGFISSSSSLSSIPRTPSPAKLLADKALVTEAGREAARLAAATATTSQSKDASAANAGVLPVPKYSK